MNKAKNINSGGLFSIMRHEFRMIFSDSGVLLITIFAMLIYTTIYSIAYGNEVVERVAIAVIDNDNSP
jgi:ABC-2 type transport system permease protein